MEETITVKELITQLLEKDMNKKVIASSVGFNADYSYDYPLSLGNITVDEFEGVVRINFPNF